MTPLSCKLAGALLRPLLFALIYGAALNAAQPVITTVAGTTKTFAAGGLTALTTPIAPYNNLAFAANGDIYFSDRSFNQVLRLSRQGVLTVAAGNGPQNFSGDGGPATAAALALPAGVAVDRSGTLYIADFGNNRIRKVTPNGIISTIAGNGTPGFSGDGGSAVNAQMAGPVSLALDAAGNLYFTDIGNYRVRRVTPAGQISTVAGNGQPASTGDNGPAVNAAIAPAGIALDSSGNLYISDAAGWRVRRVDAAGTIRAFAGSGKRGFSGDNGPALSAAFAAPTDLAFDASNNLYIVDADNAMVRRVSPNGIIVTVAGNGDPLYCGDGGPATNAGMGPAGIGVDLGGSLHIADTNNYRIRRVSAGGLIATIAGNGNYNFSGDGGPAVNAGISPYGVATDQVGNAYVADYGNNRVRRIATNGTISTIAGNGTIGFAGDGGPATNASLSSPTSVAVDAAGNVYIADYLNSRVRRVAPNGTITTVAGSGDYSASGDNGNALQAGMDPTGVAVDAQGNLYIADYSNSRVRKVTPAGVITTVAGTGQPGWTGDGGAAAKAQLYFPLALATDPAGNLYIADFGNRRVRRVTPAGIITTVAGNGNFAYSGDGGPAVAAGMEPIALAVDRAGNLLIADFGNSRVRLVNPAGIVTTIAGNGGRGYTGDGGPAIAATLSSPQGVAVDPAGGIWIADTDNNRVRRVLPAAPGFQVETDRLTFSATANGPVTDAQTINITGSVPGMPFTASSDSAWLKLSQESGTMPARLQVTVDPSSLSPGTYNGVVTIVSPVANPASLSVAVRSTVNEGGVPRLVVESASLSFSLVQGDPIASQQFTIRNLGAGSIPLSVEGRTASGGNWLQARAASSTVAPAAPVLLTVTVDPQNLSPGTYTGSVLIRHNASNLPSPHIVPVTLTIAPANRRILLSQTGLTFTAVAGGGAPLSQTINVLNTGTGSMEWQARASTLGGNSGWLVLGKASGSVGTPLTPSPLLIGVDPSGLAPGDYYGQVRVTAEADNSPQILSVVFTVLPAGSNPGPDVQPSSLIFTGAPGASPSSQEVLIANVTRTPVNFTSGRATVDQQDWFVHQPATGSVQPGQPVRIVVQPDYRNLTSGVWRGTLTLQFSDGQIRTVQIIAVVAEPGQVLSSKQGERMAGPCPRSDLRITIVKPPLAFSARAGQPVPIEANIQDACTNPFNLVGATVVSDFSNQDQNVNLRSDNNGNWTGTWTPVNRQDAVSLRVQAAGGVVGITYTGKSIQSGTMANLATGDAPVAGTANVAHAASQTVTGRVSPGGLISIYGLGLADNQSSPDRFPLPTSLDNTEVWLDDRPLPLLYAANKQVNAQIPSQLEAGEKQFYVRRGITVSTVQTLSVVAAQPGIFTADSSGKGQGVILGPDQKTPARPGSPVRAGDIVIIYATGLGKTSPVVEAGQPAPSNPVARVVGDVKVKIGGLDAPVEFAGLTPGFAGLYQVNARVPQGVAAGDAVPIVMTKDGIDSPDGITLAIR